MIPVAKNKGYSAEYAVSVTISSAIQGVVVPPSHNLILYSIVATGVVGGLSVGKLFMAGIVPGLLLLATLCIVGVIISIRRNYPKGDPVERRKIPAIIFHGFLAHAGFSHPGPSSAASPRPPRRALSPSSIPSVSAFRLPGSCPHLWPVLVRTFRTVLMVFFSSGPQPPSVTP
jgi:TRAP-type mannitol/chloroaromatic compound transport system permease large subunit